MCVKVRTKFTLTNFKKTFRVDGCKTSHPSYHLWSDPLIIIDLDGFSMARPGLRR